MMNRVESFSRKLRAYLRNTRNNIIEIIIEVHVTDLQKD